MCGAMLKFTVSFRGPRYLTGVDSLNLALQLGAGWERKRRRGAFQVWYLQDSFPTPPRKQGFPENPIFRGGWGGGGS